MGSRQDASAVQLQGWTCTGERDSYFLLPAWWSAFFCAGSGPSRAARMPSGRGPPCFILRLALRAASCLEPPSGEVRGPWTPIMCSRIRTLSPGSSGPLEAAARLLPPRWWLCPLLPSHWASQMALPQPAHPPGLEKKKISLGCFLPLAPPTLLTSFLYSQSTTTMGKLEDKEHCVLICQTLTIHNPS